jgi:hypothetical protein
MQTTQSRAKNSTIRQGFVFGTFLGAMLLILNLIKTLANLDSTGETWVKNSSIIMMIGMLALTGFIGSKKTGRVQSGALAVLITGAVSALIGISTLWVMTFVFMDTLHQNAWMIFNFRQSSQTSMEMFILQGTLGNSAFLLVFSLAFGAGYGLLGSLLGAPRATLWAG